MAFQVVMGAATMCTFGMAPSILLVPPVNKVVAVPPAANIMDFKPLVNVLPFGLCRSLANPVVIAATVAKLGVLTPMPCIPVPAGPWIPGVPKVLIGNMPALDFSCKLMCAWGGVIQIVAPGQFVTISG